MSFLSQRTNASGSSQLLGFRVSTSIYGSGVTGVIGTNRVPGNAIWIGDWTPHPVKSGGKSGGKGSGGKSGGQNTYSMSFLQALGLGQATGLGKVWQDKSVVTDSSLLPVFISGAQGQSPWGFLTSNHPGEDLGYSEVMLAAYANFDLGTGGTIPNYNYEVYGPCQFGSGIVDALATDAIIYVLENRNYAGVDSSLLGDIAAVRNYCLANGLFISPVIDQQQPIASYLKEWLMIANAEAFESEGKLKFGTYGDTAASSAYGTFTPSIAPLYDLDNSDFIAAAGQAPIVFSRDAEQDADNTISLEWANRDRDYNFETTPDEDFDHVRKYGQNIASPITAHSITTRDVAAKTLSIQLKRGIHMLRKCAFTLGYPYSLLEPMDIVSVPEQYPSTARLAVRILTIDEDEGGNFAMTAEVMPYPISAPTVHPKQTTGGNTPGFNSLPGNVNAPVFFEATPEMSTQLLTTQLALLIALSGGGPNWGGCSVHVSTDGGNSYSFVGTQRSGSTAGFLTAALAYGNDPDLAHTLSVNLQSSRGSLASVAQVDADNFRTLCVIDQELLSFETATLTGSNAYDLTYLRRGVFGSNETSHASSAAFAVLDDSTFDFPYQSTDIGKTLWFKFTSFNKANQQEQDLAAVTAYPFTLTAPYVRGPLPLRPWAQASAQSPFAPSGYTFGLTVRGSVVDIKAIPPANSFSPSLIAPVVDPVATISTGGSLPVGSGVGCVCALDSNGLYSPMSNLFEYVVTATGKKATFAITLPPGTVQYELFLGADLNSLLSQGRTTATPSSISFTVILSSGANSTAYGPPDPRFSCFRVRGKRQIHAGICTGNVAAFHSTTIGAPTSWIGIAISNTMIFTVHQLRGYTLTLPSGRNLKISDSLAADGTMGDTYVQVQVSSTILTGIVAVNDLILVRALADTYSTTSIGCSQFVNPFYPSGMVTGDEKNYVVRLVGGTGAGQERNIASNTSTVLTPDAPFDPSPGADTIFTIEERNWTELGVTAPLIVPSVPSTNAAPPVVATVPIGPLAGAFVLFEVLTQDAAGNDSIETLDGMRDCYVPPLDLTQAGISSTPYSVAAADEVLTFLSGASIVNLPPLSSIERHTIWLINATPSTVLTVNAAAGDTIEGGSSIVIYPGTRYQLVPNA